MTAETSIHVVSVPGLLPEHDRHGMPLCPPCGGPMAESDDRTRLVCTLCGCDALLDEAKR